MIDVNVTISGIIMCCDESICNVVLGREYSIEKCEINTLFFKDKIIDGNGHLNTDYYGSQIIEDDKTYFICLRKDMTIQIESPISIDSKCIITDRDLMCEAELSEHMRQEMAYLNEKINLLRLFKSGNIGFRDVFFYYNFNVMDFMSNKLNLCSHIQSRNTISNEKFILNEEEVISCNQWISDYSDASYKLMKNNIEEFSWGLEQVDVPTGFEQYTTALEMTLLPQNHPGKKQMLANRISAFLGNTPPEVIQIHQKILDFYRFRSESLHEGDGTNITHLELLELENITREVLRKSLMYCKNEYNLNTNITWNEIKNKIMSDLVNQVTLLKNSGVLPR